MTVRRERAGGKTGSEGGWRTKGRRGGEGGVEKGSLGARDGGVRTRRKLQPAMLHTLLLQLLHRIQLVNLIQQRLAVMNIRHAIFFIARDGVGIHDRGPLGQQEHEQEQEGWNCGKGKIHCALRL